MPVEFTSRANGKILERRGYNHAAVDDLCQTRVRRLSAAPLPNRHAAAGRMMQSAGSRDAARLVLAHFATLVILRRPSV